LNAISVFAGKPASATTREQFHIFLYFGGKLIIWEGQSSHELVVVLNELNAAVVS